MSYFLQVKSKIVYTFTNKVVFDMSDNVWTMSDHVWAMSEQVWL